jgi:hypothetical protein
MNTNDNHHEDLDLSYTKEADALFVELFRKDWMSDEEWDYTSMKILTDAGITSAELSDSFAKGIALGYTLEVQMETVRTNFAQNRDEEEYTGESHSSVD